MYDVKILNLENNKIFYKTFNSPYLLRKFENKARRSKKIRIISIMSKY